MEKLKNLRDCHLGMGFLILALQILFQISNIVYLFGIGLILLSLYENRTLIKLNIEKDNSEKIHDILNQYKWVNILIIFPIIFLSLMVISDTVYKKEILEILKEDSIMWINSIGIGFIIHHFSIINDIKKLEKELFNF